MNGNRNVPSSCCKVQLLQDACVQYQLENIPKTIRPLTFNHQQQQQLSQQYCPSQGLLNPNGSLLSKSHNFDTDDATNNISDLLSLTHIGSTATVPVSTMTTILTTATNTSSIITSSVLTTPVEATTTASLTNSTNPHLRHRKFKPCNDNASSSSPLQQQYSLNRNINSPIDIRTVSSEHKYLELDVSEQIAALASSRTSGSLNSQHSRRCSSRSCSRCNSSTNNTDQSARTDLLELSHHCSSSSSYNFKNNGNGMHCNCANNSNHTHKHFHTLQKTTNRSTESILFCISQDKERVVTSRLPLISGIIHSDILHSNRPAIQSALSANLNQSKGIYH